MNILLIGSGGREHALAWAIRQSGQCETLFCAPGNAGIAEICECVALDVSDHDAVAGFCRDNAVGLVVVGPEGPLVTGIVDALDAAGIKAFGPDAAAARLEGSKAFTKEVCTKYGIPTARYGRFDNAEAALGYLAANPAPIVVKADGLAAGKGVIVAMTDEQAQAAVRDIFSGRFGAAGAEVVIEEFLDGEEASFFALCDGETAVPFGTAQDHKRVGDGDTGANTGGMGAYSPAPVLDAAMSARVIDEIIAPTMNGMAAEGCPYKGVLYAGLMITAEGPKLIEYNCRFGDPECQVLMMRLDSDIVPLLLASCDGTLKEAAVAWRKQAALTVVMAASGYPGEPKKGGTISGLAKAAAPDQVEVFHAATRHDGERLTASGGRVLNVTALGDSVSEAAGRAYRAVDEIDWADGFCRRDIGWRAIEREMAKG